MRKVITLFVVTMTTLTAAITALAAGRIQTNIPIIRHSQYSTAGSVSTAAWAFPGNALSASTQRINSDMGLAHIAKARWFIAWNPNTGGYGQTAIRLVQMDDGPTNITEIARFVVSSGNSPQTGGADVTDALNAILTTGAANGTYKTVGIQTLGNGTNGPLIYDSTIEIVWDLP